MTKLSDKKQLEGRRRLKELIQDIRAHFHSNVTNFVDELESLKPGEVLPYISKEQLARHPLTISGKKAFQLSATFDLPRDFIFRSRLDGLWGIRIAWVNLVKRIWLALFRFRNKN